MDKSRNALERFKDLSFVRTNSVRPCRFEAIFSNRICALSGKMHGSCASNKVVSLTPNHLITKDDFIAPNLDPEASGPIVKLEV